MEKLARMTRGGGSSVPGDYFATHPPFDERLANLRSKRKG
jgi:Zn-dependent protease with chaperone function